MPHTDKETEKRDSTQHVSAQEGKKTHNRLLFRELREEELRKGREATNAPNTQTLHDSITHGPRKPSPLCPRGALPYRLGLFFPGCLTEKVLTPAAVVLVSAAGLPAHV